MNQSNFQRANTLKSAYNACTLGRLDGERIEQYYVDLSAVRKISGIDHVTTILEFQEEGSFSTILFAGYRGCGKSTELKRIQKECEKSYHVIYR